MKRVRLVAQGRACLAMIRRSPGTATALAAFLVASLATPTAFADVIGTQRIDDSFSGSTISQKLWWSGSNRPGAVAISQAEGHLTVCLSGRAGNDFNGGLGTRCRAHGDFDTRIAFESSAWPEFDGVWVALMAFTDDASLVGTCIGRAPHGVTRTGRTT
jgi:hypothetical protein